eukprot:2820949-Amphidinium_carterae.1
MAAPLCMGVTFFRGVSSSVILFLRMYSVLLVRGGAQPVRKPGAAFQVELKEVRRCTCALLLLVMLHHFHAGEFPLPSILGDYLTLDGQGYEGNRSWHHQFKDSAYIYIGGLLPKLTEAMKRETAQSLNERVIMASQR